MPTAKDVAQLKEIQKNLELGRQAYDLNNEMDDDRYLVVKPVGIANDNKEGEMIVWDIVESNVGFSKIKKKKDSST
ncbi:hypothetical protein P1X15_23825 [Runella sp. MFBS21]|uniref:hypothetical protein n=1 Tax=Runella sp. MFBS21 TaxID=3034018 RepID=UPI0023F88792|nr:hypothetical protein [Runella sp. MFBS21]MDF7820672.1 hypothetical protein [Runella sp. MFBS21]